jgi:succinoglycan biosynthesis protein ExoV
VITVKLFYFNRYKNFGDSINPWFWSHYIKKDFSQESNQLFVGIGTLLNDKLPTNAEKIHIMGSGAGYGKIPTNMKNWNIHCLRGPLTAEFLGVDRRYAITDPAILINELVKIDSVKEHNCSFIPHVGIDSPRLRHHIEEAGIFYISPAGEPMDVIDAAKKSERIICSAMHGAILAEALRIPWYPVSNSTKILQFKWHDWFQSMEIKANLQSIPIIWPQPSSGFRGKVGSGIKKQAFFIFIKNIKNKGKFLLGKESILEIKKESLKEAINNFNKCIT